MTATRELRTVPADPNAGYMLDTYADRDRLYLQFDLYQPILAGALDRALAHAGIADCSSLLHMYYPSSERALEQADASSQQALALDPDLAEAHAARGFALFQLRRHDEAAAEFQTAVRLDPAQFEARYFCGRQCFQRGQLTEAARWFEEAARVRENHEARFFAAQAYEADGKHNEAMDSYRKALEVVPPPFARSRCVASGSRWKASRGPSARSTSTRRTRASATTSPACTHWKGASRRRWIASRPACASVSATSSGSRATRTWPPCAAIRGSRRWWARRPREP